MMTETESGPTIRQILRSEGKRVTPQRQLLLRIIQRSEGHLDADEIYRQAKQHDPRISLSTVYRTLNLLKRLRVISETDLGEGYVRYELLERGRHHHLVCRQCGESFAFEHELLKPLQRRLLKNYGFAADVDHFAIFGLCRRCRPAEANPSATKESQRGDD